MKAPKPRRLSRVQAALATAATLGALGATPGTALAGQSYIVTLHQPPPETTCQRAIQDVALTHSITVQSSYTSSLCGFSSSLAKKTAEDLRLDPRVQSVRADGAITAA